jgi:hypothetical protein
MFDELLRNYDMLKRQAAQRGTPVTREESMAALAPMYQRYAQEQVQTDRLRQAKHSFNNRMALEQKIINDARPYQKAGAIINGMGGLATLAMTSQQQDEFQKKLDTLLKMYGGAS